MRHTVPERNTTNTRLQTPVDSYPLSSHASARRGAARLGSARRVPSQEFAQHGSRKTHRKKKRVSFGLGPKNPARPPSRARGGNRHDCGLEHAEFTRMTKGRSTRTGVSHIKQQQQETRLGGGGWLCWGRRCNAYCSHLLSLNKAHGGPVVAPGTGKISPPPTPGNQSDERSTVHDSFPPPPPLPSPCTLCRRHRKAAGGG